MLYNRCAQFKKKIKNKTHNWFPWLKCVTMYIAIGPNPIQDKVSKSHKSPGNRSFLNGWENLQFLLYQHHLLCAFEYTNPPSDNRTSFRATTRSSPPEHKYNPIAHAWTNILITCHHVALLTQYRGVRARRWWATSRMQARLNGGVPKCELVLATRRKQIALSIVAIYIPILSVLHYLGLWRWFRFSNLLHHYNRQ